MNGWFVLDNIANSFVNLGGEKVMKLRCKFVTNLCVLVASPL
jgi:hypothetical protein